MTTNDVTSEKRELLRQILRHRRDASTGGIRTDQPVALSYAQERLWFLDQLAPQSASYNVPLAYRLTGRLDEAALDEALNTIVRRHEPLRTSYVEHDGRPAGIVQAFTRVPLETCQVAGLEQARTKLAELAATPFDLAAGRPCRFVLVRSAPDEAHLLVLLHHITIDDPAVAVFHHELSQLYARRPVGPPPSFFRVVADHRAQLAGGELDRQLDFWAGRLAGFAGTVTLPIDRPYPATPSYRGGQVGFVLGPDLGAGVAALGRANGATTFMTLLAAVQALLSRYSNSTDVAVGTPIGSRVGPAAESVIGFLSNTLVMRTDTDGDPTFAELIARVRATTVEAYANQELPFERLVSHLHPHRDLAHNPLFNVMFALNEAPDRGLELDGLTVVAEQVRRDDVKFDLWLGMHQTPDGSLHGTLEYAEDVFDRGTAERIVGHLRTLLTAATADPQLRLAALPLLTDPERADLASWNATGRDVDPATLHGLIEAQVARTPDAVAVEFGGTRLTYRELDVRAARLAGALTAAGAGPETIVALAFERSAELPVALLATLKAGAAYLPLDPTQPAARSRDLLDQAPPAVVLGRGAVVSALGAGPWQSLIWDRFDDRPDAEPVPVAVDPENAAYVLYTSGSTGRPKGVTNPHRSIVNRTRWVQDVHRIDGSDTVLQLTPITFDVSLGELFWPLTAGARQVLAPPGIQRDLIALIDFIERHDVTVVHFVPSVLRLLLDAMAEARRCPRLKKIICNGEPLPPDLAAAVHRVLPHVELHNQYGPTEAAVNVTEHHHLSGTPLVPIGRPIANTEILILDTAGRPVPAGVAGEIYIAGANLARGYHRPDLTADRFVPHPTDLGARMYRSGDMARWHNDGTIAILGRADDQVKIRGHRVEPGEVAAWIRTHGAVRDAAVVGVPGPSGTRLVAYVVPADSALPSAVDGEFASNRVEEWRQVWDDVHRSAAGGGTAEHPDFSGWLSSYTGDPVPADAMTEWLDATVTRLRAFDPDRILELGCGVGLITHRIAPHVSHYHGVDISTQALGQLGAGLPADVRDRVTLHHGPAHDLAHLGDERFDLIVVNSVAQYFPSAAYLSLVIAHAVDRLTPGGVLFLGDLRDRDTLVQFHLSVELARAAPETTASALLRLARRRALTDRELVISPALFDDLVAANPALSAAEVSLRRGRRDTEMNRYRYDAVLRTRPAPPPVVPDRWLTALPTALDGTPVGVRGLLDARTEEDALALRLCAAAAAEDTVAGIRAAVAAATRPSVHPDDVFALGSARIRSAPDGTMEIVYPGSAVPTGSDAALPEPAIVDPDLIARHTNRPIQANEERQLQLDLREYLRHGLPDAMVPTTIVAVPELPLNANGKLDRAALPAPDARLPTGTAEQRAPEGPVETVLAGIWAQVLGLDAVGVDDDYFDLGGDSIQGIQIVSRAAAAGLTITVRMLFQNPTVARLALAAAATGQVNTAAPATGLDPVISEMLRADPEIADAYPLTPLQEGILFECSTSVRSGVYMQQATWVVTDLEPTLLRAAWNGVVARHDVLRTGIRVGPDDRPVQVVHHTAELPAEPVADWSGRSAADQAAALDELLAADRTEGFDLARPPLLRIRVIDLGDGQSRVVFTCHHLVLDGWSASLVLTEALRRYAADRAGTPVELPPARPYRDYVLGVTDDDSDLDYWREHLAGLVDPATLDLGPALPGDPVTDDTSTLITLPLDPELAARATEFARDNRITTSVLVQGIWALLLATFTGRDDAVFGVTVSGRSALPHMDEMVGLFVNTIAVRVDTPGGGRVGPWLRHLQREQAIRPQNTPLPTIRECADVRGGTALFDTVLSFDNYPMDPELRRSITNGIHEARIENQTSFPLTVAVNLRPEAPAVRLVFDPARHAAGSVRRLADRIATVLAALVADPDRRLDELPLLTGAELAAVHATHTPAPAAGSLAALVLDQAARTPHAPAIDHNGRVLTYAELVADAHRLAGELRARGCGPDQVVAVELPRGADQLTATLATLVAGGAFLPLDPAQPAERRRRLIADAGATLTLPGPRGSVTRVAGPAEPAPLNTAYLIYTSGSTGTPKAVAVTHAAAASHMAMIADRYDLLPGDRVLQFSAPTFDIALEQVYSAWAIGATVVVLDDMAPADFVPAVARAGITVANLPTAYWHQVVTELPADGPGPAPLRRLMLGAEAVDPAMVAAWIDRFDDQVELRTGYGLTETVITSTLTGPLRAGRPPGVGATLPGRSLWVLDPHGRPVPTGIVGEVHLGGDCLGREYWRNPAHTADRFRPDHLGDRPGGRLYRTGDLARRRGDGELELLGRVDRQIKVRGIRVEPGEVEAALRGHPVVTAAVVIGYGPDGLAGFVTATGDPAADGSLRDHLRGVLPAAFVPDVLLTVPAIPMTTHGKIDHAALLARAALAVVDDYVAPRGSMERLMAEIWGDVLGLERVSATDDFFELGGHSLKAMRLLSRLRRVVGVNAPMVLVLEHPRLDALCAAIAELPDSAWSDAVPARS